MRKKRRHRPSVGAPPGTLQPNPDAEKTRITLTGYDGAGMAEKAAATLGDVDTFKKRWSTLWVEVDGLSDLPVLEHLGRTFDIHPLTLEDIANVRQRPKVEDFPSYQFVVLRIIAFDRNPNSVQMSFILGDGFILSFKEREDPYFQPVKDRLRKVNPRIRQAGADYLAYSLIDTLVDRYFPIVEDVGERVETLQEEVLLKPNARSVGQINELKRDLLDLRRAIWPLRESLSTLMRSDNFIRPETRTYLRDTHDHTLMLIDLLETIREVSGGLMDLYLSSISNRMNEVMKVLTIISTVFIPLTFITGLYGMNFNTESSPYNMPELTWYWGYPAALASMVFLGGGISLFMWRLGWFRSQLVDMGTSPSQATSAEK